MDAALNGGRSRSRSPRDRREREKKAAPDPAALALKQAKIQEKRDRERIRRLLITLGDDDNKKIQGQIKGLVGALEDDVELHGDLICDTLIDCIQALPTKTGIFAAWVARMSKTHMEFIVSLVGRALDELRAALRAGASKATTSQLFLRFFVCLGNTGYLPLPSLVALLREVLSLSDGLKPQKGGDLGAFLMLSSLLFLSPKAYTHITSQVDALLAGGSSYVSGREASWKPLLRLLESDDTPLDRLDSILAALQTLKAENWVSDAVFHVPGYEPNSSVPDEPALPPLDVTSEDIRKSKTRYQPSIKTSRLVTNKLALEGADDQMSEHAWWVLEDYVLMIVEMFAKDIDECSKQILRIPLLHPHFEAIVVETLFSQMLRLPSPSQIPLFYSRLLQALVEKQFSIKEIAERAFTALFEQLPVLDEDAVDTLAEAYSYHLHVNDYKADWSVFSDRVKESAPLERFLRRSLERLQRLSFHDNLLHKVPQAIHPYIPPEPLPSKKFDAKKDLEFGRMVGIVRIKDPDEKLVVKYCMRLMKVLAKEEEEGEDGEKQTGADVSADSAIQKETAIEEVKETDEGGLVADAAAPHASKKEETTEPGKPEVLIQKTEAEVQTGGVKRSVENAGEVDAEMTPSEKRPRNEPDQAVKSEEVADAKKEKNDSSTMALGVGFVETKKKEESDDRDHELGALPDEPWTLESTTELVTHALLLGGSKTPTHWSRMLDAHQRVLRQLLVAPKDENKDDVAVTSEAAADTQLTCAKAVVAAVFEFWENSAQRLEITVDSLLQREWVTPRSVVEFALSPEKRGSISACDSMSTWNVIHSVLRKSIEKSQTARAENAVAKKLGQADILARTKPAAEKASAETTEVFTSVFAGLVACHKQCKSDLLLSRTMLQRLAAIGRKYQAFIRPLIEAAETKIPGVEAATPEIVKIFSLLRTLG